MAKKSDFYQRMLEAKKFKKQRLEQEQLAAEFEAHPERFNQPQPIIVKSDAELKMDAAFSQLQAKLGTQRDLHREALEKVFNEMAKKAEGL